MRRIFKLISCIILILHFQIFANEVLPLHDARDAYTPCVAFGNEIFVVAWQSGRTAPGDLSKGLKFNADIVFCRINAKGKSIDSKPIIACSSPDLQEMPRIAFGDGVFLLVWQDIRNGKDWDIYATRINSEGKVLDSDGLLISGGIHNQAKPKLVWDGKNFIIVWQDFRNGKLYESFGARVTAEGKVLDPQGIKISSGSFYHSHDPVVASAGSGVSLIMSIGYAPFAGDGHRVPVVQVQFLKNGALEGAVINASKENDGPGDRARPIWMVAGKDSYLATWKTDAPLGRGNASNESHAALFKANGERFANLKLALTSNESRIVSADVAWDGNAFVAVWTEYLHEEKKDCPVDIAFTARISEEGKILGSPKRIAGKKNTPAANVSLASDGAGTSLVAYEQHPSSGKIPIQIEVQILNSK